MAVVLYTCASAWSLLFRFFRVPRGLHSFPTRRSSDLHFGGCLARAAVGRTLQAHAAGAHLRESRFKPKTHGRPRRSETAARDRKSTRLNSSHEWSSYAVFCLKKKIGGFQGLKGRGHSH